MARLLPLLALLVALLGGLWLVRRGVSGPGEPLDAPLVERASPSVALVAAEPALAPPAAARTPAPGEAAPEPPLASPTLVEADVAFPRSRVAGRVVNGAGEPVGDADVAATCAPYPAQLGPLGTARSRADGSFELDCLGTGPFRVAAARKGETGALEEVEAGRRDVEIVLNERGRPKSAPTATLSGTVLDPNGAPVFGAAVIVRSIDETTQVRSGSDLTNKKGRFELRNAPTGAVRVVAGGHGFASSDSVDLDLASGAEATLELRLRDSGRVTGVVRGRRGLPLAGVEVRASRPEAVGEWSSSSIWNGSADATTDAAGCFALGVLPGRVKLWVDLPKDERAEIERARGAGAPPGVCVERSVTVGPGESAHVEIAFDCAPIRLHGSLEVGGRAPASAAVSARADGVSELRAHYADGSYDVVLPGPGTYRLLVYADDTNLQPFVDVPEGSEHRFDVVVPLARVEGRVRDDAGTGLAGVTVDAMRHGAAPFQSSGRAVTGADGEYAIEVPAGTYRVFPREDFEEERSFEEGEERIVTLVEGAPERGVDFELRGASTVEGVVRMPGGAPAPRAGVELVEVASRTTRRERTDEDGRFRFTSLPHGRVWVRALAGVDGPSALLCPEPLAVDVVGGTVALELELVPTARLRVAAAQRGAIEALDTAGRASAPTRADSETDDVLYDFALVPGTYLVRARRAQGTIERAIELTAAGLDLDLRAP